MTDIILKIRDDINCQWETALAWALNAKNSFINVSGFSPHQLVFGKSVNLPSTMNDNLSAGHSDNPLILEHLQALHSAREEFMKSESSNKLRNKLRKQTRHTREHFDLGQEVYYKRSNDVKWKGPGKVIGQDGSVVFVRHGGFYVRVHCSRIQTADSDIDKIPEANIHPSSNSRTLIKQPNGLQDSSCKTITKNISPNIFIDSDTDDDCLPPDPKGSDNENIKTEQILETPNHSSSSMNNSNSAENSNLSLVSQIPDKTSSSPDPVPDPISKLSSRLSNINLEDLSSDKEDYKFKKGQLVTYRLDDTPCTVEILSRVGKAIGKYKNHFNVEYKHPCEHKNKQGYVC